MKYDTRVGGNLEIIDRSSSIWNIDNFNNEYVELEFIKQKKEKKICLPKHGIEFFIINKIFKLEFHYHNFENENVLTRNSKHFVNAGKICVYEYPRIWCN